MLTLVNIVSSLLPPDGLSFDSNGSPNTDPIQLRNISGLEPTKGTINTTPYGSGAGGVYTGASVDVRNIVLTMGLAPDYATQTMEDLRQILYRYFMPPLSVVLQFKRGDLPDVQIQGYVESISPNIFSQDPECDVSIICPDPDFIALQQTRIYGVVGSFGALLPQTFSYAGNNPSGFDLIISSNGTQQSVVIPDLNIHVIYKDTAQMWLTGSVDVSDFTTNLEINTSFGSKAVVFNSSLVEDRMDLVPDNTDWPVLFPGNNTVSLFTTNPVPGAIWELKYQARFAGL